MTDKQALRERYSEKPAPKCHICGSVMTIQRASAGSVVYGCTGRIDKDGEGYKFADGRDFADDHYARSRVTEYGPGGDPDVLALLDELEAAKQDSAKWFKAFEKAVSVGARYEERIEELTGKLEAAEKRIAELEARTVTLEPFRSFVTDADIAALHRFAECCDDPESGGHDLEKEQVQRLEAIGALQRSGRISYITGFGDVLISITAGIGEGA